MELTSITTDYNKNSLICNSSIRLNNTELEVLNLICNQLNSSQIAEKIFRSIRTVENIRFGLLRKTDSVNNVGLVLFAVKHGYYKF
jgi:DNA-binding CsgD family transcriptional regulator